MNDEIKLMLSCVPTVMEILTEQSSALKYLSHKRSRSNHDDLLVALGLVEGSEEQESDSKRIKLANCDEAIDSDYLNIDFEMHFKMSKSTVQEIINIIERAHLKPVQRGRPIMPLRKLVLLSIWLLTNKEGFRSVADRFEIGKGHAHRAFEIFCGTLHSISHEFIKWPDQEEAKIIMDGFEEMSGFPSVIGAVGIIHVAIPKPSHQEMIFCNNFGYHSVLLQAICNHRREFINVLAGPTGVSSEAEVWTSSPLYERLVQSPEEIISHNGHILSNLAYPLSDFLLPPYNDKLPLTPQQEHFNSCHKIVTTCIKDSFKLLLSRFQRLTFLNMTRLDLVPKVIIAATVLHNVCLMKNEKDPVIEDNGVESFQEVNFTAECDEISDIKKRNEIAQNLFAKAVL